jgi:hypothetical protein
MGILLQIWQDDTALRQIANGTGTEAAVSSTILSTS